MTETASSPCSSDCQGYVRRHLRFGWWSLLVFLTLGILLESFHGFKAAWFVNVDQETRRLLWRLAHAHGTFFALVHIAFAATVFLMPALQLGLRRAASWCLMAVSIVLPSGFFFGGFGVYGGDPGLGIFLLPVGAVMLFIAVFIIAWGATANR